MHELSLTVPATETAESRVTREELGINGLVTSFQVRNKFSWSTDGDLIGSLEFYERVLQICKLSEPGKADALSTMLTGDAFSFHIQEYRPGNSYALILQRLIDHSVSEDH